MKNSPMLLVEDNLHMRISHDQGYQILEFSSVYSIHRLVLQAAIIQAIPYIIRILGFISYIGKIRLSIREMAVLQAMPCIVFQMT